MAFSDLTDIQREGIAGLWDELADMVRKGGEFEAACKEADAASFSTAMRVAMLALGSKMHLGYGPAVVSQGCGDYFDENCGAGDEEQAEFAKRLRNDLARDCIRVANSLRSARDALEARADELERLAEMADAAADAHVS